MTDARKQVRGEELVAKVMKATLAEVARAGLEHLSIEEVAARANVNKTSIYRRWPTPKALAHAALLCAAETSEGPPNTGTLRGDLRAFAREFRRIASMPDMKTIIRMRWGGAAKGPLAAVMHGIQEKKHAQWKLMLRRAAARGELPRGSDVDLAHDIVVGTLLFLVVLGPTRSDEARLDHAIDAIIDGIGGARTTKRRYAGTRLRSRPRLVGL
jgi:AcrR family transcriptional regulator